MRISKFALYFAAFSIITSYCAAEEPACKGSDLTVASTVLNESDKLLDRAISALQNPDNNALDRLATWLGVRSSSGAETVRNKLVQMRAFTNGATFRCAVKTDAKLGDVYAYVKPDKAFVIVLGRSFFNAQDKGFVSKPGILIHEMSHFLLAGATADPKVYGPEAAKELASTNPSAAQNNAENYEYFSEALYFGL